jgi:Leucine Rich repeat
LVLNSVGDVGASAIAAALRTNKSLTLINLMGNSIGPVGATTLAEVLISNRTLQVLGLGGNSVGDGGAVEIAGALCTNKSLKKLSLVENSIGNVGVMALAEALKVNTSLKVLYLGENKFRLTGLSSLAEALAENKALRKLMLEANSIGNDGAAILSKAISRNKSLRALSLQRNRIESEGGMAVLNALKGNRTITSLDLTLNEGVSAAILCCIHEIVKANKSVQADVRPIRDQSEKSVSTTSPLSQQTSASTEDEPEPVIPITAATKSLASPLMAAVPETRHVGHVTKKPQRTTTSKISHGRVMDPATKDARERPNAKEPAATVEVKTRAHLQTAAITTSRTWSLPVALVDGEAGRLHQQPITKATGTSRASTRGSGVVCDGGAGRLPQQRAELEFELRRLASVRDECLDTLEEDRWQASVEAEEKMRLIQQEISSGKYPTGDDLENTVNKLIDTLRDKLRNDSVSAALPLRERLVGLQKDLAREREAEARTWKEAARTQTPVTNSGTSRKSSAATAPSGKTLNAEPHQVTSPQLPALPVAAGHAFIHAVARSPFPPYSSSEERPVEVDFTYRGKKNFLGSVGRGKTIDIRRGSSSRNAITCLIASGGCGGSSAHQEGGNCEVAVNAYRLNESQIQWFRKEFNIHMEPNQRYWYDKSSGFFGKIGKRPSCTIDPCIPLLGDMHRLSSIGENGPESGIVINGRCIDRFELESFYEYGMDKWVGGQRYAINPAGFVSIEPEPGCLHTPPFYNWREKAGLTGADPSDDPQQTLLRDVPQPALAQTVVPTIAPGLPPAYTASTEIGKPRDPPPPYHTSGIQPVLESFPPPLTSPSLSPPTYEESSVGPGTPRPPALPPYAPSHELSTDPPRPTNISAPSRPAPHHGSGVGLGTETNGKLSANAPFLGLSDDNDKKGEFTLQVGPWFDGHQLEHQGAMQEEPNDANGEVSDSTCTTVYTQEESPEHSTYRSEHDQLSEHGEYGAHSAGGEHVGCSGDY